MLVLLDGSRPPSGIGEGFDLSRFPRALVSRIEVIEGPGAVIYGSEAMGGVLNVITKDAKDQVGGLVGVEGDSIGSRTGYGQAHGALGPIRSRFFIERKVDPGFDLDDAKGIGPRSLENQLGFHLKYDKDPRFSLSSFYLREDVNRNKTLGLASQESDTRYETLMFSPTFYLDTEREEIVKLNLGIARTSDRFTDSRVSGSGDSPDITDSDEQARDLGLSLNHAWNSAHRSETGLDFRVVSLESDRIRQDKVWRRSSALFLQHYFSAGDTYGIVPGVRMETDSDFGENISKSLAFRYKTPHHYILRLSYGEGFRAPSFKNLAVSFENPGIGYVVRGNPDLKPERSQNYHLSFSKMWQERLWIELSAFHNQLRDLIDISSAVDTAVTYSYKNTGNAFTRGFKLAGRCNAWSYWRFGFDYNFLEAKDLTLDRPLEGRAKHSFGTSLGIDTGKPLGWSGQLSLRWKDKKIFYHRNPAGLRKREFLQLVNR